MKYISISDDILNKIQNGEYKEGQQLPTETEFGQKYGVSKITIKKALNILTDKGLIYRLRGSGTFVRKNIKLENTYREDQIMGFTRAASKFHNVYTKVLDFEIVNPTSSVASFMNLSTDEFMYKFDRLRFKDDKIVSLERSYVPIKYVSGLSEKILEGSLFEFVEKTTKSKISSVHKTITIVDATKKVAKHLQINEGDKVVFFEEIHYLTTGEIFEYSTNYMTCDAFNLFVVYNS